MVVESAAPRPPESWVNFSRTSRRGFLGGSGLAAMSAVVGGAIPFAVNLPRGLIPAAMAQATAPAPLCLG